MVNPQGSRIRERLINLAGSFYLTDRKKRHCTGKAEIIVVNYHRISPSSFRNHLDYIRSHYQILSPETFLSWLDNRAVIDKPSVLFSFDDAYLSFYEEIYPILKEAKLAVFMFVPTGFIGKTDYFWEDELKVAIKKTNARSIIIGDKRFYLHLRLYRTDFYENILRYVHFVNTESRHRIRENIFMQLNVKITENDMKGYRFLSWPQILEMEKSGLVVFGSHTVGHPNLVLLSDDAVRFELQESKRTLENRIGKPVQTFAYPYGGSAFFHNRIIDELERTGYVCAFTTIQGKINEKRKDRFRLKRLMLFDYQNEGAVALKLDRPDNWVDRFKRPLRL